MLKLLKPRLKFKYHILFLLILLISCKQESIKLEHIINLQDPSGREEISGGSGIVRYQDYYFIIRDNSYRLYQFGKKFNLKRHLALFKGTLPKDQKARKKIKPDLEAALLLPLKNNRQRLLMIPSGSKKKRNIGAIVDLNELGIIDKSLQKISFKKLYKYLKKKFHRVNIEGAVLIKDELLLFQRGNSKKSMNAIVYLDFEKIDKGSELKFSKKSINKIIYPDLGSVGNVRLTFTDAYYLKAKNKIVYLAAAEHTADAYLDGDISGSHLGLLTPEGKKIISRPVSEKVKLEGITPKINLKGKLEGLYLISDADKDGEPSHIYLVHKNKL